MLVFIDESGDPGDPTAPGASDLLVIAVVTFEDHEQARRCTEALDDLARELGRGSAEFKFSRDSHRTRMRVLGAVRHFRFTYHALVFDKRGPWPPREDARSLYAWASSTAIEEASARWLGASVVLDSMGDRQSQRTIQRHLRAVVATARGSRAITKLRSRRSQSERLLQLADYVAGIVSRRHLGKKWAAAYSRVIEERGTIRIWDATH